MAVRFSPYWIGTQFHPEATADGMIKYLSDEKRKKVVIEENGEEKYLAIMEAALDPEKLDKTRRCLLPRFLENTIRQNMAEMSFA